MSFGTMYIASTGLNALGTGMGTISNNLANSSTVGYKTMRTNYQDFISESHVSGNNRNQVGKGSKIGSIQTIFTQGAFRSGQQDTDIAIAGEGFFNVRHKQTGDVLYTRAGVYKPDKNGFLEDPSGNVIQGWQMSVPRPGETPVRVGEPVDIQINALTIPPVATSEVWMSFNLNAEDEPSFLYPAYGPTGDAAPPTSATGDASAITSASAIGDGAPVTSATIAAQEIAKASAAAAAEINAAASAAATASAIAAAKLARDASAKVVWDPGMDSPISVSGVTLKPSNKELFNTTFTKNYNEQFAASATTISEMQIVTIAPPGKPDRTKGEMTQEEFDALVAQTEKGVMAQAEAAGQKAYNRVAPESDLQWEGHGYAAAWDPNKKPAMDPDHYSYAEPITVYDASGGQHTLMAYYQKNPHMENVWDYIVTTEPLEDARATNGGPLFASDATFKGLLQKGKLTFSSDDTPPGKAGLIKSMEAQNIDLGASLVASTDAPTTEGSSSAMQTAKIGGYYTGVPGVDPETGQQISTDRTYTVTWGYKDPDTGLWSNNTQGTPPKSAMTWEDNEGNIGHIVVSDKGYPGPYNFGSGLSVTFESNGGVLNFGEAGMDGLTVVAHSEQVVWDEAVPNANGYFDLNMAFVDGAANLNPPFPTTAPILEQTVAFNQGAKFEGGNVWVPNSAQATTQFGGPSTVSAKEQDGYPEGSLDRVYIREDGMVMGIYSPKREEELYQIALTRFISPWGLNKQGDNLFSWTPAAGDRMTSTPGVDGNGTTLGSFLEQSTVDTAREIVNMMLTQRGFQANSKAITTSDSVLATAIQVKK